MFNEWHHFPVEKNGRNEKAKECFVKKTRCSVYCSLSSKNTFHFFLLFFPSFIPLGGRVSRKGEKVSYSSSTFHPIDKRIGKETEIKRRKKGQSGRGFFSKGAGPWNHSLHTHTQEKTYWQREWAWPKSGRYICFFFIRPHQQQDVSSWIGHIHVCVCRQCTDDRNSFFFIRDGEIYKVFTRHKRDSDLCFCFFFDIFPLSGRAEVPENEAGFCGH